MGFTRPPKPTRRTPLGTYLPAHLEPGALSATIHDRIEVEDTQPATSIAAALPNLYRKITTHNDVTGTPLVVASIGTSVGVGASTPDPATQAPGAVFTTELNKAVNRLGNMTLTHQNSAVNGSVTVELLNQYNAAKTAAGVPTVLFIVPGMNDGMPFHYHSGQTYNGVYDGGKMVIEAALADGVDVVIATTPHPSSTLTPWSGPGSWAYPQASPLPMVPDIGMAASVTNVAAPSGAMVPASRRHLRVNETFRRLAGEYGLVIIDAERYHFDACAKYGEAALHTGADYAHPNLFGHQQTYGKATAAFIRSLTAPLVQASASRPATTYRLRKTNNSTRSSTTRTIDSQLQFYAGANTVWEVEVDLFYYTDAATDLAVEMVSPAGTGGRFGLEGPATTATTHTGGEGTFRSGNVAGGWMPVGGHTAEAYVRIKAVVRVGATAGTVGIAYGQGTTSGSVATVYNDSVMRAIRIS